MDHPNKKFTDELAEIKKKIERVLSRLSVFKPPSEPVNTPKEYSIILRLMNVLGSASKTLYSPRKKKFKKETPSRVPSFSTIAGKLRLNRLFACLI